MAKDYTADDYKRMLITVIDAHYGTAFHHIGDGDGIPPDEANEIIEFWRDHLHEVVAAWRASRATTDAKE